MASKQKGQILVIVLIVMMILGITIVAITNNVSRDVKQSASTQYYERLYTKSEDLVFQITQTEEMLNPESVEAEFIQEVFSKEVENLIDCSQEFSFFNTKSIISCSGVDTNTDSANETTTLRITESPFLEEVLLSKDDFVILKIDPALINPSSQFHDNVFNVVLTGEGIDNPNIDMAIEVVLDFAYTDLTNTQQYSTVRGIFDRTGNMFPDLINDYFVFNSSETGPVKNSFTFAYRTLTNNIQNGLFRDLMNSNNISPIGLRFKLLYKAPDKENVPNAYISVSHDYPQPIVQTRMIEGTRSQTNTQGEFFGPQPRVRTSIPMMKIPAIMDYAIRTQSDYTD
jgi:hypothetical protein